MDTYLVMNYKTGKDNSILISSTTYIGDILNLLDWINDLTKKISIKYKNVMNEKNYSYNQLIGCVLWRVIGFCALNKID